MFERVQSVFAESLGMNPREIHPDTQITALGINSLVLAGIVGEFEMEFDIEVPEPDMKGFTTVEDIVDYLEAAKGA